ncbi:MAG: hypothetical protein IPP94_18685 [Ignavibacteria bacterium]|nr:hypothetical protein [Ignavibacteria bacterium]
MNRLKRRVFNSGKIAYHHLSGNYGQRVYSNHVARIWYDFTVFIARSNRRIVLFWFVVITFGLALKVAMDNMQAGIIRNLFAWVKTFF